MAGPAVAGLPLDAREPHPDRAARSVRPLRTRRGAARRSYGAGSLFERDGAWYGEWRVDGRQIKRRIGPKRRRGEADGLTRSQAEKRLPELMAEVSAEDVRAAASATRRPHHYTIAELSDLFIGHAREVRGLKEGTTRGRAGAAASRCRRSRSATTSGRSRRCSTSPCASSGFPLCR